MRCTLACSAVACCRNRPSKWRATVRRLFWKLACHAGRPCPSGASRKPFSHWLANSRVSAIRVKCAYSSCLTKRSLRPWKCSTVSICFEILYSSSMLQRPWYRAVSSGPR